MPPKFEIRDDLRTFEEAGLENKLPIYADGKMIVEDGQVALKDDMMIATRKYRAPYGMEELELNGMEERSSRLGGKKGKS